MGVHFISFFLLEYLNMVAHINCVKNKYDEIYQFKMYKYIVKTKKVMGEV
jgi:hypothetical protein